MTLSAGYRTSKVDFNQTHWYKSFDDGTNEYYGPEAISGVRAVRIVK